MRFPGNADFHGRNIVVVGMPLPGWTEAAVLWNDPQAVEARLDDDIPVAKTYRPKIPTSSPER